MTSVTEHPTDVGLLDRFLSGDRTALARIVEAHEGPLLRYAGALLGDPNLAQDAVQETFLRLLREGQRMRGVQALFPWLVQVTRNVCLDLRRKEGSMDRRHEAARGEAMVASPAAEAAVFGAEARERVRAAVAGLPEPQRQVLTLKLWEGLSYREIGARLGLNLSNVGYHLAQAVKAVAGQLKAAGITGTGE